MKFLLICTVIILASMTEAFYNEGELTELDGNFLRDSVIRAKRLVDKAYAETRKSLKLRAKREAASFADIIAYVKQPVAHCRNAIRVADYMDVTLRFVEEKIKCIYPSPFNISDVLTAEQKEILNKLTGCAYQYLPKNCSESPYRTINGECNNRKRPTFGASNTAFIRLQRPVYEDGAGSPRGWTENLTINGFILAKVREVSNVIAIFLDNSPSEDEGRSQFFMQMGQIVAHEMTLSPDTPSSSTFYEGVDCATSCARAYPCFPVPIPENDPRINQSDCIPFFRSAPVCNLANPVREQINAVTGFIDGSHVYGSNSADAIKLRNFTSNLGLLAINQNYTDNGRALLPFSGNNADVCTSTNTSAGIPCFLAGDNRVSQHPGLVSFQTLLLREHNRVATELHRLNPHWSGEKLFQEARKIIVCTQQKIIYKNWLPLMLGRRMSHVLPPYTGYNDTVNPGVANIFSNALRIGHTTVYSKVFSLGDGYQPHKNDSAIPLHQAFFNTWRIKEGGIDSFIRGMIANSAKLNRQSQIMDEELRDHLFEFESRIALDLAAINLQRGRDHGLPGYNSWRRFCGLSAPRNFSELAIVLNNTQLAQKFKTLYGATENMDFWIVAVSEPLVPGGRAGELLTCIIGNQFRRTRDGDRFYYENKLVLSDAQRSSIEKVTLSQIICANTNITDVPANVFLGNPDPKKFVPCSSIGAMDLNAWKERSKSG